MFRLLLGLRAGALMTCVYARAFERKGRLQPWAQRLLHDCILGDATLYSRADAIESAWKICQPILDRWEETTEEISKYEAGTWGPLVADELIESDGRHWGKV